MIKHIRVLVILATFGLAWGIAHQASAAFLGYDFSYQAIVKIYTYYQDSNYNLVAAKTGSGVIISEKGLILTNEHVVSIKDSMDNDVPVTFKVCFTENFTKEPICSYYADLIAKDDKKDIALLQMKNLSFLNPSDLSYMPFAPDYSFNDNDSVVSLGYPSSGGETITVSKGSVIGTLEKYNLSWIKTDAFVSYGSSGGALIDTQGRFLGITSAINGDVGYVINVSSIRDWVGQNGAKSPQTSNLKQRMVDLINRQNKLKDNLDFNNNLPKIQLIRSENWKFNFDSENIITAYNNENVDGGYIRVRWEPTEILIDDNALSSVMKFLAIQNNCFSSGNMTISGKQGRKVICPIEGNQEIQQVILGLKNYFVFVSYYYGKDKIDKQPIDFAIGRLLLSEEGLNHVEIKNYEQQNPFFKVSMSNDWSLKIKNSTAEPLSATKKTDPNQSFGVYVGKLTDGQINITNQEYFDYIRDGDVVKNQIESATGLKGTRYFESTDYKANDELAHVIFYKYKFKDEDDGDKIKYYSAGYRIRSNNKVIILEFDFMGESEAQFDQYLKDFQDNVLVNFTLGLPVEKKAETVKIESKIEPSQDTSVKTEPKTDKISSTPKNIVQSVASQVKTIKNLGKRFIGKILLRVQNNGEAWYLSPKTNQAHYLANGEAAYQLMREQGMGMSTKDLAKIPVGLSQLSGDDADQDGLTDALETAIGTDKDKADTDGDGFNDKDEMLKGYNPSQKGMARSIYNLAFANKFKGKILLQVESRGQAWYVNPKDGKRYFLGTADDAYQVMKQQSMGIAEKDFVKL
ncbi:MAG: trypsin-like peptidase domain-containing protein [Patescibacteria group bacterium]|jgi:hypothetical protein